MKRTIRPISLLAALAAASAPAAAADQTSLPIAASTSSTWDGFYVGAHAGFAFATSDWSSDATIPASGTVTFPDSDKQFGPLSGGFQIGYNYTFPGGILLGLEGEFSFPDRMGSTLPLTPPGGPAILSDDLLIFGSLRGRVGYAQGDWLFYGAAGFAYDRDRLTDSVGDEAFFWRKGWTAGLGTEVRLTPNWSAKLEYSYFDFDRVGVALPLAGVNYRSNLMLQTAVIGLNYRFGNFPGDPVLGGGIVSDLDKWSLHGQTSFIPQGDLSFHSPYSGAQSLYSGSQIRETWSVTGFFGYKPIDGTEFYYDPEPFQGFGLSETHGLAGYPNGEAQKAGFDFPHYNTARAFVRETFGLGGEQEDLPDGPNQVASKVDIARVTVTAGKMAVGDVFDNNTYAHDSRTSFMNWSLWEAGAFDYSADQSGYAYGLTAELNQKAWAARAGYFLVPTVPNGNDFDTRLGRRGEYVAELEERYSLFSQPGKLRLASFVNECFWGSFAATLADPALNLDIAATRQTRMEYGFYANLEQAITDDFGIFSRVSWNSGQNEVLFTDINESFSFGGVLNGTSWGRPDDKIGLAGVVNGISSDYQAFLAAGGLGINIGDGQLNYRPEQILEAYYAYKLTKSTTITFDYQFVANPGYNADRGPVSIGSVRVHAEF